MSDEIFGEFAAETREYLNQLDQDLIQLESGDRALEILDRMFRLLHTIKGGAASLGLLQMESVSHGAESVLELIRERGMIPSAAVIKDLFQAADVLRRHAALVERDESDAALDASDLAQRLQQHAEQAEAAPAATPATARAEEPAKTPAEDAGDPSTDRSIRIDVSLVDDLMDQVGELVLARNRLVQRASTSADSGLIAEIQGINQAALQLQASVTRARMQPAGRLWSRLPRLVRDTAAAESKQVELELEGEEVELDRSIMEAIRDPLAHLIRNAISHGIETPERRIAAGKPAAGRLRVSARHHDGRVLIEVRDDGAGIDVRRVVQTAVAARRISEDRAARLSDADALKLIFLPGLSTADSVTKVSGRGVGMDVVRANIERVGGNIRIDSRPGAGALFTLSIPLTLTIIPALIVVAAGDRYVIPQTSIQEILRLEHVNLFNQDSPVLRLRGRMLPLASLNRALGLESAGPAGRTVVVLQTGDGRFGLIVDGVEGAEAVVVKPLNSRVGALKLYSGATILGSGEVALILNAAGVAESVRLVWQEEPAAEPAPAPGPPVERVLLVQDSAGNRVALGVDHVTRIERFAADAIERAGGGHVVQYRGSIVPIAILPGDSDPVVAPGGTFLAVVCQVRESHLALAVHRVLDVADAPLDDSQQPLRPGFTRTAVVEGKVTEFVALEEAPLWKQEPRP